LICDSVIETIIGNGRFDEELFNKLELDNEVFDIDDARACFGAVNFIITSACIHQVPVNLLRVELEQLGLASEHAQLVCSGMSEKLQEINMHL